MPIETNVIRSIHALRQMTVSEMQTEWLRLNGEPTRSKNRDYLYRRLAWRIQELQHGGLSKTTRDRIDELAPTEFTRARTPQPPQDAPRGPESPRKQQRDPRLPAPGTVLTKQYKGRELRLVVHDDHFELDGRSYRSLSEAARYVTGSRWNGRLFWGLTQRKRK